MVLGGPAASRVSIPYFLLSLLLASGFLAVASPANIPGTLAPAVGLRPSLVRRDPTAAPPPAARLGHALPSSARQVAASRGAGAPQAVMDMLAVVMQDLLTQNHALRKENEELMDQVQRLLCEKANLLAQVRPPACPVTFPETFKGDSARLPEFLVQAASYMRFFEARFPSDTLKVAFLISRLSGAAEEWVVPYIERESRILAHYESFVGALERAFGRNG